MGKRGPKKLPQVLQDLKGNPEHRPRLPDAVKASGAPELPLWVNVDAMNVFNKVVASMPPNFYASVDMFILTEFANACALAKTAIIDLQENGITITEWSKDACRVKKNPAHSVWSDAAQKIATLGTRLGLDPTARQAIVMPDDPDDPGKKGFGDLITFPGGKK